LIVIVDFAEEVAGISSESPRTSTRATPLRPFEFMRLVTPSAGFGQLRRGEVSEPPASEKSKPCDWVDKNWLRSGFTCKLTVSPASCAAGRLDNRELSKFLQLRHSRLSGCRSDGDRCQSMTSEPAAPSFNEHEYRVANLEVRPAEVQVLIDGRR